MTKKITDNKIGEWLRAYRITHNLTITEFAARLETPRDVYRLWEQGRGLPKRHAIYRIATLTGASESELLAMVGLPEGTPIGNRLRIRRKEKGLTRDQAAERIGVEVSNYARWEWGKARPRECYLSAISKTLDIPLDELKELWSVVDG